MAGDLPPPTPVWTVIRLLWTASRRRATGRAKRQKEIMGRRRQKSGSDGIASLSWLIALLLVCFVHISLGWFAGNFARTSAEIEVERSGRIPLSSSEWHRLEELTSRQGDVLLGRGELAARPKFEEKKRARNAEKARDEAMTRLVNATEPAGRHPAVTAAEHRAAVERQFFQHGEAGFARLNDSLAGQLANSREHPMVIIPVLSFLLLCWVGMLICQGEGLELDVQRRRYPMWEWLLSHPVRPAHAFYVELLTPLMANPVYLAAPLFLWVLLGPVFGAGLGLLAALLIGLPIAVVSSSVNKAIETTALLRISVRSRGALLGVVSWFGYVAMLLPLLILQSDAISRPLGQLGAWFAPWFPAWPVRTLVLGWAGPPNLAEVVASWWVVIVGLGTLALVVTHRATAHGLQAPTDGTGPAGASLLSVRSRLGANPLRRKELLWLLRDKGAVVQVFLVPLTIAATQMFNFRGLYRMTSGSWTSLCGLGIICGTYFLLVLGPRSLASEGAALWLSLTWPRGLEDLLKAKARLWSRVANFVVGGVLAVTCLLYPSEWWKIALVGCGWLVFSSTLALKAVSLVTAPSSSGEPEPPNRAAQWIAMIGTLAFGTGVVTGLWHIAILGIVFSSLIAVAMWQGLRTRLPFLFDRWSEPPIPAPSLLHATVGIALQVEFIGVTVAIASTVGGPSSLWLARAVGYGLAGAVGCVIMHQFLSARGVSLGDIVRWPGQTPRYNLPASLALGAVTGVALAVLAAGYLALLHLIPAMRESLDEATRIAATYQGQQFWIFLLAVVFAPVAEEYFFRGLLFRALDRELGDWRALVLSAAVFAIFHPPMAWVPVACLGLCTAWLFRRTRHLLPSVICHVSYNAMILLTGKLGQ
ncbi:MAG TPA: CPBP family intramembrane glutamic endopeptidase [Lacunisphaera sp.]|jgi:membrane protease YdiL (CAAX protease family)